ncbi:hypothetical protein [Alkalibacillus haloalkaliphilus]|uniref:hypothetical protein n=1 Tax=Alkalibacillus haloalkaliphilus TaxID=94136 RepID=UPI0029360903|nr:hypothetical protein [Alkalibacillus haloalkaliphilus]MDV2582579.1 hypothetical protein [Alkalibacillus haloalkaliphilus]
MGIPVDGLFYIFLAVIGVVSFVGGLLVLKKSRQISIGFLATLGVSILLFIFLFRWFQSAATDIYMGTIPWLFNQAFAIILYILFLVITLFVFQRIHKESVS